MSENTLEKLKKLNDAIATGSLEVWFADRRIRYRDLNEMLRIRAILQRELNQSDDDGIVKIVFESGRGQ